MAAPAPLRRERAADLTLVADILGHADVRTARRYTARQSRIAERRCRIWIREVSVIGLTVAG
jgi:integrase